MQVASKYLGCFITFLFTLTRRQISVLVHPRHGTISTRTQRPPSHLKSAGCLFSPLVYVESLIWEHNSCWVPRNIPQNYTKPSATSSACKLLRWRLTLISQTHVWQVAFTVMDLKNRKLVYLHCCFHCYEQYKNSLQGYNVICELKTFQFNFLTFQSIHFSFQS